MIDILPGAEEQQVIDSVTSVLADLCPLTRLRDHGAAPAAHETAAWRRFAELGWFGMSLPEALGGIGLSANEETLMHREFGRQLLSPTLLATSLAAQIAARSGQAALAAELIAGRHMVGLAVGIGGVCQGPVINAELHLFDATAAELVTLMCADGAALLRRADLQIRGTPHCVDSRIYLERALAQDIPAHAWLPLSSYALQRQANLLIAAELVGIAEATRDMAVAHARMREQFGKPIGSFQAISHYCADMAVRAEAAGAQTLFAAIATSQQRDDANAAVHAAFLIAQDAAFRNATINIRIHGGIGYTADCDAHHYLKRSLVLAQAAGGARVHQVALLHSQANLY